MAGTRAVGVVGAGTMGTGIAQLAAQAGAATILHDADGAAVERALARLDDLVARGRLDAAARERVTAGGLGAMTGCEVVVEAVAEDLAVKRDVLSAVAAEVAPDCVLATNTSSLSVTAIAAGVPGPERVVGMHFFNPAPLMALVEVVAGEASGDAALGRARALGAAMERRVIDAADGPGFLVNRCNRPFALEGMRLVQERLATPAQVDRVCRMAGGFRMGPFELMDLVGLDVSVTVAESFHRQSYGEPRWRPSPLAARLVAAGRLGRKTGRGWYEHGDGGRPPDPTAPEPGGGDGRLVVIAGEGAVASAVAAAAAAAGWAVADPVAAAGELPALILDCGAGADDPPLQGAHQVVLCDQAPLAALDPGGTAAGFHLLPPLGRLAELTAQPTTAPGALEAAEAFFATLGMVSERVGDAPGLVLGRIVAQLVNEAAFALGEGVGSAADIDAGMELGLNHPRGPLAWGDAIGLDAVLGILAGLEDDYREERYRPAPALLRAVRSGTALA